MSEPRDDRPIQPDPEPDSRRGAVIGLAIILALVVAGYFLMTALHEKAALEDCLMSGRKNCAPIEVPARK
jgi:hypothetical protein